MILIFLKIYKVVIFVQEGFWKPLNFYRFEIRNNLPGSGAKFWLLPNQPVSRVQLLGPPGRKCKLILTVEV